MSQNNTISILLVEDDEGHADLVKWNLEKVGVENPLYHVKNGQKAIDFLMRQGDYTEETSLPHDNLIMLLDINMPVMDGHEVLERVRSNDKTKNLPIIMLTTAEDKRSVKQCYASGCNLFLKKPVNHTQFVATIQQLGAILPMMRLPQMTGEAA